MTGEMISGVPDAVPLFGLMLAGLITAWVGWLAWTGRYRGWGRRGGLIDTWTPMLLFAGTGWFLMFTAFLIYAATGSDRPPLAVALGVSLFGPGLLLALWGMIGAVLTMGPAETYRKKPNGTWVTRLFLPRWYHEYLRDTFGGRPRR